MTNGTPNTHEWIIVHGESEAVAPAMVEDCYSDREPYGEYLFFAASNPESAGVDGKISIGSYRYLAEARVTFEEDLIADGNNDIDWCDQDFEEQGEAFVRDVWPSWQDVTLNVVANSIFPPDEDFVMAKCVLGVGEDHASWLELTRIESNQPAELALTFCRVQQERLLEVRTVLKDPDVPVYVLVEMWETLVERFRDLPYEHLSGAKRIEPESDFDDLETDEIGEPVGEA